MRLTIASLIRKSSLVSFTFALVVTATALQAADPPAESGRPAKTPSKAHASEPLSLDALLDLVKDGYRSEQKENRDREARFVRAKDEQAELLNEIRAQVSAQEARSEALELTFAENELSLAQLADSLEQRLGNMGELFGVVRQVAGDMQGHVWESVTSSQLPSREGLLEKLGRSKELPKTDDLEKLWFELHREMTQQGKIASYPATVLTIDGDKERREVVRAGVFSVISDGRYLIWDADIQTIRELNRQPPTRYVQTVAPYLEREGAGFGALAIDPSRGSLLTALIDTPSQVERVQQGGAVGYAIIAIGLVAMSVGIAKFLTLSITSRKVNAQRQSSAVDPSNPLGRVLLAYEENASLDPEALELRLDQAVLEEADRLDRFMWLVRVVSVVAPLMGLLGTVTGMIQTFQAITLYGTGDPKLMAGGISQALVTTVLGLSVAIPMVLLHTLVSGRSKRIVQVLQEQSAGIIAEHAERQSGAH
jgi:biopolymer transport protein ExbB